MHNSKDEINYALFIIKNEILIMSQHRDYVFFIQEKRPISVVWFNSEDEEVPKNLSFSSRSDIFGIILRDIVGSFPDLTALQFFKENNVQDLDLSNDVLMSRLVTFDRQQQKDVVNHIKTLFDYTKTQPKIFEEWAHEFWDDPLDEQLEEIEKFAQLEWNLEDPPYSDHDSFQDFILLLKSIQFFFETALEHNKFIGYFDYIG